MRHYQSEEFGRRGSRTRRFAIGLQQLEPEKAVTLQRQQVRQFAYWRKAAAPEQLDRLAAAPVRKVELDRLRRAREIGDAQDDFVAMAAQIGDDLAIGRIKEVQSAAAECALGAACRDQSLDPVQQRRGRAALRLYIDRLEAVDRIHDR